MTETVNEYDAKSIEKYWQEVWKKEKIFSTDINSKKKTLFLNFLFQVASIYTMWSGSLEIVNCSFQITTTVF